MSNIVRVQKLGFCLNNFALGRPFHIIRNWPVHLKWYTLYISIKNVFLDPSGKGLFSALGKR